MVQANLGKRGDWGNVHSVACLWASNPLQSSHHSAVKRPQFIEPAKGEQAKDVQWLGPQDPWVQCLL